MNAFANSLCIPLFQRILYAKNHIKSILFLKFLKEKSMARIKIQKKPRKSKYTPKVRPTKKPAMEKQDKFKDNYLNLLEEIEIDEDIFNEENNVIEDKLLIVDGSSLLSTSFYATARDLLFAKTEEQKEFAYTKLMKSPDGEYTNGIYMFFKTLLPLLESQKITHLDEKLIQNTKQIEVKHHIHLKVNLSY